MEHEFVISLIEKLNIEIREQLGDELCDDFSIQFEYCSIGWADIINFMDTKEAYIKIVEALERHMPYEERGFYDDRDKFKMVAYNAAYDLPFLEVFFNIGCHAFVKHLSCCIFVGHFLYLQYGCAYCGVFFNCAILGNTGRISNNRLKLMLI